MITQRAARIKMHSTRPAATWLTEALDGHRRVGLPWLSPAAILRIATNPRAVDTPLDLDHAWDIIDGWLAAPVARPPSDD